MNNKNGYIFGVNIVLEGEEGDKLYIFIEEKSVWDDEKEYDGVIRDEKIGKLLGSLGIVEESETVFSRPEKIYVGGGKYKENPFMTRQEIINKLTELGFEYNKSFENGCANLSYP